MLKVKQVKREVSKAVQETREELKPFLEKLDIEKISKHNRGYLRYAQDPVKHFIDGELIRYLHTVNFIYSYFPKSTRILDIGFFIPVVPIGLSKLGFKVSTIEKLSYYEGALDKIISFVTEKYGIKVIDFDLFKDNSASLMHQFDVVLLLAILEHLNGTPMYLLEITRQIVNPDGYVIVEVPNIESLSKRLTFLIKGKLPYPPFEDYFYSEYPFSGHNREYTISDLKYALIKSGFDLVRLEIFHHNALKRRSLKGNMIYILELIGPASWRPNIWAVARPKSYHKRFERHHDHEIVKKN